MACMPRADRAKLGRMSRAIFTSDFMPPLPGVVDRWAGLFVDAAVGAELEKSLSNIKQLAEAR